MRWIVALGLMAGMATAEDRALILANGDYRDAPDIAAARTAMQAGAALQAAGFSVVAVADQSAAGLRARLSALLAALAPEDRVVILIVGHFAQGGAETWALGTEARLPDLAQAGGVGVSLATVLAIAGQAPGGAIVLLGTDAARPGLGQGLEPGIGPLVVPQGVALIRGEAGRVADFAARRLTERGVTVAAMLADAPDLTGEGFLPSAIPFRPAAVTAPAPLPTGPTEAERAEEARNYAAARATGTIAALEAYLTRYPAGLNAVAARTELARLRADPGVQARLLEEALTLSRDQRRAVQRQLSLLGFDPKGIDGLFGPGSRAAIAGWQGANAEQTTGFLTRDQILRLTAQADRRAAELEAEATARRAETERQDRLFWDQTGAKGDEPGLRAYVKRYPDGLFAELAAERLKVFEDARRAEAAAQDRAAYDRARAADTAEAYRAYLATAPEGAFAAEAAARIAEIEAEAAGEGDRATAEANEAALQLNPLARSLIERRLDAMGLKPGEVDGVFDDRTRRAIRRFQAARGMEETGYLDQASMVALLAGGVLQLGD